MSCGNNCNSCTECNEKEIERIISFSENVELDHIEEMDLRKAEFSLEGSDLYYGNAVIVNVSFLYVKDDRLMITSEDGGNINFTIPKDHIVNIYESEEDKYKYILTTTEYIDTEDESILEEYPLYKTELYDNITRRNNIPQKLYNADLYIIPVPGSEPIKISTFQTNTSEEAIMLSKSYQYDISVLGNHIKLISNGRIPYIISYDRVYKVKGLGYAGVVCIDDKDREVILPYLQLSRNISSYVYMIDDSILYYYEDKVYSIGEEGIDIIESKYYKDTLLMKDFINKIEDLIVIKYLELSHLSTIEEVEEVEEFIKEVKEFLPENKELVYCIRNSIRLFNHNNLDERIRILDTIKEDIKNEIPN